MSKVIVALDYKTQKDALAFVNKVSPKECKLKVGKELFTATGRAFVEQLVKQGFDVFLDLKFHDIPNTVASVLRVTADMGIWMVNVHGLGGPKMLSAAAESLANYQNRPLLIGVTVLTSMDEEQLQSIGIDRSPRQQVALLAHQIKQAGLDGVVCSAHEVDSIKKAEGKGFLAVTPGIRPPGSNADDQSRIMTPVKAIEAGADYLVIGRPITQAANPLAELKEINRSLKK